MHDNTTVEGLVQWELEHQTTRDLENFFYTKMVFHYTDDLEALLDALQERHELTQEGA